MAAAINPVRGTDHPLSKLNDDDIRLIRECVAERERLRQEANRLSNEALAEKFGVHHRTIERITGRRGWIHIRENRA
jgi:hypothetical protein